MSTRLAGRWLAALSLFLASLAPPALAQTEGENPVFKKILALDWKRSPDTGGIDKRATIKLDGGLRFLESGPTAEFLSLNGNLPRADSYTLAADDLRWFAVLDFTADGYVKDDEKIDGDGLLEALKDNNRRASEERKKRGMPALVLEGWHIAPRYDPETRRLEWATLLRDEQGNKVVNFSTKLLGRRGHTTAILVSDPANLEPDIKDFKTALKSFEYVSGERYSEWTQGEKVAAYGLGALVLGGAAAMATKKGFWAALAAFFGAFWKLIAGVAVAAVAGLGSMFKKKA